MATTHLERAHAWLACHRVALVGASRNPRDFSRAVLKELVARGYDVVPVALDAAEIEGRRPFPRVGAIDPPVEAVLVMTPAPSSAAVARDALAAGVRRIWFHRGSGLGCASAEAVAACRAVGVEPVTDLCPFMALPGAGLPHRVHAFFRAGRLARGARHRAG